MSANESSASTLERRYAGTLRTADVGTAVRLQAWVHRRRDLGGLLFLDLRDRSGIAQAVVYPDDAVEAHQALEEVRSEWVVEIEGTVVERESKNKDLPTGDVEVRVRRAVVLSRSDVPPISIDGKIDASEELRLKHRFLELRRPELMKNFLLRDRVVLAVRTYMHEHGFVDLETPILTRSTPEGARDYLVPSRVHRGQFYALPQSPQLFKQILMMSGFDRYYQVARCFRDEDLRAERQPEFTQIDVELSFTDEAQVQAVIEGLLGTIFPLAGIEVPRPFPRMTWHDAMARYGSDKPDLRFGLEIAELTGILGDSAFRGFQAAKASGGVIRGFAVPAAAQASRKQVDGWVELARRYGAAGALTLRHRDGALQFQVKDALTEGEMAAAAAALGLEAEGLALVVAGPEGSTAKALGALRLALAEEYGLVPRDRHAFLWVTDFPLVEWDEQAGRWFAMNHPFTAPDPRDLHLLETDTAKVRSRAYDVVMDGVEIGGGSIRIHTPDLQRRVFELLGIGAEEAQSRFGFLLEALRYGAPPHGGIALGVDRLIMMMTGASSIRDVILFPKTTRATCLMTEAPSPVDARQLEELGIAVVARSAAGDGAEG